MQAPQPACVCGRVKQALNMKRVFVKIQSSPVALALLVLSPTLFAQQPPTAGSQMQQLPRIPSQQIAPPEVQVEQAGAPAITAADTVKIIVNSLKVTGAQAYPEAQLIAAAGFTPGRQYSLSDLRAMAARIADYYHQRGYFVAQAYLPAQAVTDGVVTIAVMEGQYGKVTLRNQSGLSDGVANSVLGGLDSGDAITAAPLDSRLLRLSDVPGVKVRSTLVPGASVGTSDLIVEVIPGRRVTGSIDADNAGNRYTGAGRIGGTVNFNNPTGHGDLATLRALTSASGLNYARASYQLPVGRATVGVAYSYLGYSLGREFESLEADGNARIASLFGSYPLVRSRNSNLYAVMGFDGKTFEDREDITPSVTDKKARVLFAGVHGDHRDGFGGGGFSTYSLTGFAGELDIRTAEALAFDALGPRSNGSYQKLAFTAGRLQRVTDRFSVYGGIAGQLASKNLDVSEKMELGGMYAVRAYPEGEAYADQGYVMTLEARMELPVFSQWLPGQLQAVGFVDHGAVTMNKDPWGPGDNNRTLSGAGVGLDWSETNNFLVRAYYAFKLGNEVATSAPDKSGRFWIQLVKYF